MKKHKRRLLWSSEAEGDLLSVWHYGVQEWSPSTADKHEHLIWRACNRLREHPELGRTRDELLLGMRSILINPHVVFYRISDSAIEIIRVTHQHEDIETTFA